MTIWLCAVAKEATLSRPLQLPRRLVWVVDRRVVVDEATDEAVRLAERLTKTESVANEDDRHALSLLRRALGALSLTGAVSPLGVSTLRGELADNGEWRRDPSRPAIIVGTVDMVGSRLLFSGYGDREGRRPFHAGLIGQDAMIVNDEAHLTPTFAQLLEDVKDLQRGRGAPPKECLVLHLSASLRDSGEDAFRLDDADRSSPELAARLHARKKVEVHRTSSRDELEDRVLELALSFEDRSARVLIYLNSVEALRRVAARLRFRTDAAMVVLTGTLRGHERDHLVSDPRFQRFLMRHGEPVGERTSYLLSTSAGEVGVNMDADDLVCDLTTADRMIQRLGRVNRSGGERREAKIHVVVTEEDIGDPSRDLTLKYLQDLPVLAAGVHDGSPLALYERPPAPQAFSEVPPRAILTTPWLDALSLTSRSVSRSGTTEILSQLLRGVQAEEPEEPDCYVVWRADVPILASERVSLLDCERALEIFEVRARERLRERRTQVVKALGALAKRSAETRVILRGPDGRVVYRGAIGDLSSGLGQQLPLRILDFATLFLPLDIGGLEDGLLSPPSKIHVEDVADLGTPSGAPPRGRYLVTRAADRWDAVRIGRQEAVTVPPDASLTEAVREVERSEGLRCVYRAHVKSLDDDDDAPAEWLLYFLDVMGAVHTTAQEGSAQGPQALDEHLNRVASIGCDLGEKLGLTPSIVAALDRAGAWHDLGKRRESWQAAIGNQDLARPLAKSGPGGLDWRVLRGYRHEIGSLLDVGADAGYAATDDVTDLDLALHLVASHHGHARPSFPPKGFDTENPLATNIATNEEVASRFARLQDRFGWWGLAYLEAVFKSADALASTEVL